MLGRCVLSRRIATVVVAIGCSLADLPAESGTGPADGGAGFRLEGKAVLDDVFGDASDYRRTVDRFLELTTLMQSLRDDFARAVQTVLGALGSRGVGRIGPKRDGCPVETVAGPYARAHRLGADYLRIGRELTRHYEQVREFDHLGESVGLTPDYRWKVHRVLHQYGLLLTDYREMKIAFHDQLTDELKYAGCNLTGLLMKGDPQAKADGALGDEPWPQPGTTGAPGVLPKIDRSEIRDVPPPSLPAERLPIAQPIPPLPSTAEAARSGILFYVDNTRCTRATTVFIDGKRLGEVPAAVRVGFQTGAGPHTLCLLDGAKKTCGAPGTVRKSYLSEGWTISLRCD